MFLVGGILMGRGRIVESFGYVDEVGATVCEVAGGVGSGIADILAW
ncbi:hypothetical protein [Streptomyces sp. PSKA30]|nr:hypothetical protein [Streptomyces sp. PSKA30]